MSRLTTLPFKTLYYNYSTPIVMKSYFTIPHVGWDERESQGKEHHKLYNLSILPNEQI